MFTIAEAASLDIEGLALLLAISGTLLLGIKNYVFFRNAGSPLRSAGSRGAAIDVNSLPRV